MGQVYVPRTFLISPIFFCVWPSPCSALPATFSRSFPVALPAASLTLPAISLAVPSTLSLVLDFMFFDFLLTKTCRRTRGHRGCVACQKRLGCGLPCCSLSRKHKRKFEGVLWGVTRSTPLPHGPVLPLLSFQSVRGVSGGAGRGLLPGFFRYAQYGT